MTDDAFCPEEVKLPINQIFLFFLSGRKKKKPIQTKYRMPLLNWQALKSNQVTGTVFNELDDERVLEVRTHETSRLYMSTVSLLFSCHSRERKDDMRWL